MSGPTRIDQQKLPRRQVGGHLRSPELGGAEALGQFGDRRSGSELTEQLPCVLVEGHLVAVPEVTLHLDHAGHVCDEALDLGPLVGAAPRVFENPLQLERIGACVWRGGVLLHFEARTAPCHLKDALDSHLAEQRGEVRVLLCDRLERCRSLLNTSEELWLHQLGVDQMGAKGRVIERRRERDTLFRDKDPTVDVVAAYLDRALLSGSGQKAQNFVKWDESEVSG